LPNREGVYERLDSAYSRRKVVRHDERSAHGVSIAAPVRQWLNGAWQRRVILVQTRFGPRPGGVPGVESPEGVLGR
jgi:hypothetical protein